MTPAGFPHSDIPGSTLGCQLPRAYRRLPRPSSALDAKASTMRPYQLATQTTNTHARVHYPEVKNQEAHQRLRPHPGPTASDASDTQQRITQNTHPQRAIV